MAEVFSSPFAHVLHTNYAASPSETLAIQRFLVSPRAELSALGDEICRIQKLLDELMLRRTSLETHVHAHLALVSPFRRLPRELISEIFVRCLPEDRNPTRSLIEAPLLLTVISKELRDIALSTPQLWTALHVFLPTSSLNSPMGADDLEDIIQRRTEGVETWFTRSRSLPLSISVHLSGFGRLGGSVGDFYIAFLKTIVSSSRRWKHIELHLSPFFVDILNTLVDSLKPEDVPWLKSVEIFYDNGTANRRPSAGVYPSYTSSKDPMLPLRDLIVRAPSLQSFAVHHHSQSLHQLQLPWSNLTDLTMKSRCDSSRLTLDQTINILASSPNLLTCTLGVLLTSTDTGLHLPNIVLNSLQALSLYFTISDDDIPASDVEHRFHCLFNIICAPHLARFAFIAEGFEFRRGIDCIPFKPLLKQSGCKLEELYLSFPLKSQHLLVECLQSLPTITHLRLESCAPSQNRYDPEFDPTAAVQILDDVLIGHLTISPDADASPLCPRLEKLVLPECKHVTEKALISFAQSRSRGASRRSSADDRVALLKLLDVRFSRNGSEDLTDNDGVAPDSEFRPSIEGLRDEGTIVNWKYPVRETSHIPDSPWGGQHKEPYLGWNPEILSEYIRN